MLDDLVQTSGSSLIPIELQNFRTHAFAGSSPGLSRGASCQSPGQWGGESTALSGMVIKVHFCSLPAPRFPTCLFLHGARQQVAAEVPCLQASCLRRGSSVNSTIFICICRL